MNKQFTPNERLLNEIDSRLDDENRNRKPCGLSGFAESPAITGVGAADGVRINCGLTPLPLPERKPAPVYPLDALGDVLGSAAERIAHYVQAPKGMAGQSLLAAAAFVVQPHIQVARGNIGISPVSLFCLTVADSGDRKSTVDKLALSPVREFESVRRQSFKAELQRYEADLAAWQLARDSITKGSAPKGKTISMEQEKRLADELAQHESTKPVPPKNSNITFEEPTAEGIWRHYQNGLPSAGLFSDEGVSFFNGHGMTAEARGRTIGMMSHLWDGKPISRTRGAQGESGTMAGCRLSTHLMIQPVVSAAVLADPLLQGQGFLARFLVCHEPSLTGTRFLSGRNGNENAHQDPAIQHYWATLRDILDLPLPLNTENDELEPDTLKIEGEAYAAWVILHDGIEKKLEAGGAFVDIKASASKAADNAARIAAILAFVEHHASNQLGRCLITAGHIERAGRLISYYLESMRLRAGEAQDDIEGLAAADLLAAIQSKGGRLEAENFKSLPTVFRNAKKARSLLAYLTEAGYLKVTGYGGSKGEKPNAWEVVSHD